MIDLLKYTKNLENFEILGAPDLFRFGLKF